ncbi:RagB/SusD family nutrient uptake outer membrane protein [Bacteroides sp. 224]|uniref:RagB/SusD family nutrient uptake outer membrane protein n=1 Tax=Bacteroides sp. 224 TaxID=2302936 RepID=UPI0013D8637A|nr:RagB/SusD family nutrient uptake outer membrane protein [Bacteroides sp. 224]NDV65868.1 SusD/RagB family nutrient-binding outer membrane lipoprotein [Bacteroides sp. 224]
MKKNIINKLIIGSFVLGFISCTDDYLNINSHPYQPGDLTADDYALGSAMSNLASTVISSDVNTAQFTDCLLGGPMGGYFADSNSGWQNTISNFDAKNDWTRVFLISDRMVPTVYSNLNIIKTVSETTKNPVPYAIAQIIKVASMNRVTDTYGAIPYSKIGEDGKITTPYDSQEEVYIKFFEELDAAISTLTEHKNAALVPTADFVYRGNIPQWIKFGNSLKLRLAMRIAYAKPEMAKAMAESAVKHEMGLIETNDDNATWKYFGTIANPIFTAVRYNEATSGGDTHAAADIVCYMNGYKDNRRASYFEKSGWPGEDYVGLRRSINLAKAGEHFKNYSQIKMTAADPVLWMNAAEVAFLRAEGKAIFGFDMGGEAANFYNEGIRLSFEQWGVSGADQYLDDDKSVPGAYKDPSGLYSYSGTLSDITIKWNESATIQEKQERIITQKWIANWPLGNEAWADYRRTGFPKLLPATDDGNRSGGVVNNSKGARRMPYPSEEYTNNTENIQYAVKQYLGGPDNMGTDVWWARKK